MGQSNLSLIYSIFSDGAVLSGGNWQAGSLRLDNLRTPYLAEVARSLGLSPDATLFNIDLGANFGIGGIVLGACNATPAATVRISAYDSDAYTGAALYDSGWVLFPGALLNEGAPEWEDNGYWDGLSREFADSNKRPTLIHLPALAVAARFWRVEIRDYFNPAGFFEIGRLIMGARWSPVLNYTYDGNSLDFEDLTGVEESRSGVRFYDRRPIRRSATYNFDYLPDRQTYLDIYRIVVRNGRSGQVVVIPNPDDPNTFEAEAFIGTFGTLPSLRRNAFELATTSLKIEEVL